VHYIFKRIHAWRTVGFFGHLPAGCRPRTIDPNKWPLSNTKMCDVWVGDSYIIMPHMFSYNNKIIYYTTVRCDVDHTLTNKSTVWWCEKSVFLHITGTTIWVYLWGKNYTDNFLGEKNKLYILFFCNTHLYTSYIITT